MLVCVCNGISDRDIDSALHEGASSFKEVRSILGFGACCGQCATFAKDMVDEKITHLQASNDFHLAREIHI